MIMVVGHMAADSHDAGAVVCYLYHEAIKRQREQHWAWCRLLRPQNQPQCYTSSNTTSNKPSKTAPPTGNTVLNIEAYGSHSH